MAHFEFRSPLRKLVAFFKASRDKWKGKCQQTSNSRRKNLCAPWTNGWASDFAR